MCRTEGAGSLSHFSSIYSLPSLSINAVSFPSRRMHAFFSNKPTKKQVYSHTSNVSTTLAITVTETNVFSPNVFTLITQRTGAAEPSVDQIKEYFTACA